MAKTEKKKRTFPILSLSYLAEVSGVDYKMIYNNVAGNYESLKENPNLRTTIVNAAYVELVPFFEFMGYELKMKKKPVEPKL